LSPIIAPLKAQTFKLLRFEEDWKIAGDSGNCFYQRIKSLPLSNDGKINLSLGGEIRYDFGGKVDEDWIRHQGFNYSILQRYSLHSSIQLASDVRVFFQMNSALEAGSKYGAAATDEDKLNVQNLFADLHILNDGHDQLTLRLGRQEVDYGSGRLVSVRDGNNARQYFTGAKMLYSSPKVVLDAFFLNAGEVNPGIFDNLSSHSNLWGCYSKFHLGQAVHLDIYYLGTRRDLVHFEAGTGRERRHTLAARYWGKGRGLVYNLEAAYQFGAFQEGNISAWTTAVELGYTFQYVKYKPSINLRNDYISGDHNRYDRTLQTFNPLYPKGGYFGFNPLVGPSNLIDVHPYLILQVNDKLTLQTDIIFNWRYSLEDGLYRPSGTFNASGAGSEHRYVGTSYLISSDYQFGRYLTLSWGLQYFSVGSFLKDIMPRWANSKYFNTQLSFKF